MYKPPLFHLTFNTFSAGQSSSILYFKKWNLDLPVLVHKVYKTYLSRLDDIRIGGDDICIGGKDIRIGGEDIRIGGDDIRIDEDDICIGGEDIRIGGKNIHIGLTHHSSPTHLLSAQCTLCHLTLPHYTSSLF